MLSDACFEFLETLREAAGVLAEQAALYVNSPLRYGDELDALLAACRDVQRPQPWNEEEAIRLIKLAGSILIYHDTPPGSDDQPARLERMNS